MLNLIEFIPNAAFNTLTIALRDPHKGEVTMYGANSTEFGARLHVWNLVSHWKKRP